MQNWSTFPPRPRSAAEGGVVGAVALLAISLLSTVVVIAAVGADHSGKSSGAGPLLGGGAGALLPPAAPPVGLPGAGVLPSPEPALPLSTSTVPLAPVASPSAAAVVVQPLEPRTSGSVTSTAGAPASIAAPVPAIPPTTAIAPPPVPPAPVTTSPPAPAPLPPLTYTVRVGDSLFDVARWFSDHGYGALFDANQAALLTNLGAIQPGERITLSATGFTFQAPPTRHR